MADAASGTYGILRLEASIAGVDAAARWHDVSWAMYHIENGSNNLQYNYDGVTGSVSVVGVGVVWSGTFTFDWRPGGNQVALVASGTTRVYHNADGSPPSGFQVSGSIGDTGSNGAGRGASVAQPVTLPTLTVVPGTPSGVTATRSSDTSINVAWSQTSASNGVPSTNTIRRKINDGAWGDVVTIAAASAATISAAANQKLVYGVKATNAAGATAWSADSVPVYTTPGAPTDVSATKSGVDIIVAFTSTVAFAEHQHVVEASSSTDGGVTWSAYAPIAASPVVAGVASATHAAPDPAKLWRYRVTARNTDVGALTSAAAVSNTVQLLAPPLKPTIPTVPAFADKAATFRFPWVHNAVDTTVQAKAQWRHSTDGGTTWTTSAKTASANQYVDFAASTWAANVTVMFQVRTKGTYDVGSDGDASYSPWSDPISVTFKTRPVVTIISPATSSTYPQAALAVELGFAQAEGATFVSATIELYDGVTLLEQKLSTTLASTSMGVALANAGTYDLKARVIDSNGIVSSEVVSSFDVAFTPPPAAAVTLDYLDDNGWGQIGVVIPAPGVGEVAAHSVKITRTIAGVTETVVEPTPAESEMAFLDTTPSIYGDNLYRVITISADGATTEAVDTLTTSEEQWAFFSKGAGYSNVIRLAGSAQPQSAPEVESELVRTEGRALPLALYGTGVSQTESGTAEIITGTTSSREDVEEWLKIPGRSCFRDPSGRRLFGRIVATTAMDTMVSGAVDYVIDATS